VAQCKNSGYCCTRQKTLLPARQQAVCKSGKAARAIGRYAVVSRSPTATVSQVFVFQGIAIKVVMLGFSMFVCTLALADHKGAHECIGKKRLDLATATAKYEP